MDVPDPSTVTGVQDLFARYAHRIDRRDFDRFRELFTVDAHYARALQDCGAGEGTRVAVALRNSPEFVTTVLAAWKLGAVPVPVRWDLPDWERERVLEVIDGVTIGVDDLPWLIATHDLDPTPLP